MYPGIDDRIQQLGICKSLLPILTTLQGFEENAEMAALKIIVNAVGTCHIKKKV